MSSLTFPTRPHAVHGIIPPPGLPARATACQCEPAPVTLARVPRQDQGRCLTCGRWTAETIADTFRRRAAEIAKRAA